MNRRIEVKLAPTVVDPLIGFLRVEYGKLALSDSAKVNSRGVRELDLLLDLFDSNYRKNATITVDRSQSPKYLRACSFMRLRLRASHLSSVEDVVLEMESRAENDPVQTTDAGMTYLFLATLQELLITHFGVVRDNEYLGAETLKRLTKTIGSLFPIKKNSLQTLPVGVPSNEKWDVVVLNDPVNLMNYVTLVFQRLFEFPSEIAKRHMREVHELQSSLVWQGSKEQAELYAQELRDWYLTVETHRSSC